MNAVVAMSPDAVAIAEREHMVWVARHAAPASGSPFLADTSTELLRTIAEVLDIRSVFPRVSEIVKQVLPHGPAGHRVHPPISKLRGRHHHPPGSGNWCGQRPAGVRVQRRDGGPG